MHKSDLKLTSTEKARSEDQEKKAIESLRVVWMSYGWLRKSFMLLGRSYAPKQRRWIGPVERLLKLRAPWSAWLRNAIRYAGGYG